MMLIRKLGIVAVAGVMAFGLSGIAANAQGTTVVLNGTAKVTTADIVTSNGVIHVIDSVLTAPMMMATMEGTMMGTMEGTMMASTMEATMEGTMMGTMEGTMMASTMEGTMMGTMEGTMMGTMEATMDATMADMSSMTIAQVVASNPDFSILAALITKAGLLPTFEAAGTFTVFAPTNAAFEAYVAANGTTLEAVSALDAATLTPILAYHVVADKVLKAADLVNLTSVTTLAGTDIAITVE